MMGADHFILYGHGSKGLTLKWMSGTRVKDTEVYHYIPELKERMLRAIKEDPPLHPDDCSPHQSSNDLEIRGEILKIVVRRRLSLVSMSI